MTAPEAPAFSLKGLVCLVTGGGSGIGQATAEVLAAQGAAVAVNDIQADPAHATARLIGQEGNSTDLIGDVTQPDVAVRVVERVVADYGHIDVVVNNAAAHVPLGSFMSTPPEDWNTYLSSLWATLACTKAALPHLIDQEFGRIVNVTSISGSVGVRDMVLYGAGKGAVHAFTAGLAKEVAHAGVTVNCVAPGTVDTPRQQARPPDVLAARRAQAPLGRFATPTEIGHAVAFLAARESAYITGEILFVDGGRP